MFVSPVDITVDLSQYLCVVHFLRLGTELLVIQTQIVSYQDIVAYSHSDRENEHSTIYRVRASFVTGGRRGL